MITILLMGNHIHHNCKLGHYKRARTVCDGILGIESLDTGHIGTLEINPRAQVALAI